MSVFKTYKVKVTFDMVTHAMQNTPETYKSAVWTSLLCEIQNKIRLALIDNKDFLFTDPKLTATEN